MYEPQQLHPLAYLSGAINFVKNMFFPVAILLLNTNFAQFNFIEAISNVSSVVVLILAVVFILIIGASLIEILNIHRTRFWIEDNKFHYHDGVFVKRERELNIRRIDSVDITEPIYLSIFGASRLRVTTPGEGLTIAVIKKTQALELQDVLYTEKEKLENTSVSPEGDIAELTGEETPAEETRAEETERQAPVLLFAMTRPMLILMAMTSGALGSFLAIVAGFTGFVSASLIEDVLTGYLDLVETYIRAPIIAISIAIIFFVAIAYVIGTILIVIRYYNYSLKKRNDDLIVEYGLIEKKHRSVNIERVQGIVISDTLIRRMFGFYNLSVIISSDAMNVKEGGNKITLLPFVKKRDLYAIIDDIFPNYNMEVPPKKVPIRAYRRFFQVQALFVIILTVVAQIYLFDYAWIAGIILFLITFFSGVYNARNTGYKILHEFDEINMMSTSFFTRSHYAMKRNRVIHVRTFVHPMLKFDKLAIITITMAAGFLGEPVKLRYLAQDDVDEIWEWVERGMQHEADIETRDYTVET